MMKATVPSFIASMVLLLCPVRAMINDLQEEERLKTIHANLFQQSSPRKEPSSSITLENFPEDILSTTFVLLDISDFGRIAQVSTHCKKGTENPDLWTYIGSRFYGDYLSKEDLKVSPKQQVIFHYLSVIVNATEDLNEIERLVNHYKLCLYYPLFRKNIDLIDNLITNFQLSSLEDLVAQGNRKAIERKLLSLTEEKMGTRSRWIGQDTGYKDTFYTYTIYSPKYLQFNDLLVEKGDSQAIERKIMGLTIGDHGYEKDPSVAKEFNDVFAEKGDIKAIERKIEGLTEGKYGYERNLDALRMFNDLLTEKGDIKAIERKIEGLTEGKHGYTKDLLASSELNDFLVEQGDSQAIKRKIEEGLCYGKCGYEKDLEAARKLNDFLVEKGNSEAIERKIKALLGIATGSFSNPEGCTINLTYGYKKDLETGRELNEQLVERGDSQAIQRKIDGLVQGYYGYGKDLAVAVGYNCLLIEQGNLEVIKGNIGAFIEGGSPIAARVFIETLVINEFSVARAIGKYIKAFAMKYGFSELGYERDRENAIRFIKENHIPY